MSRRMMVLSIATLAVSLVLAACGDEASSGADETPPASADLTTEPTAAASNPSPAPAPAMTPPPAAPPSDTIPNSSYEPATDMGMADRAFGLMLPDVVTPDGLVRYDRLAFDLNSSRLGLAIKKYGEADLPEVRQAQIAYYCNVYNANLLLHALMEQHRSDFTTLLAIEGLFDKRPVRVAGEPMPFNLLENDRIRPLGDPRIHAALVCGAMSCPPLRREVYRPDILDEQLDDQCRRWINDPTRNRVENGVLKLSEIFNWYGGDFDAVPYGGVVGFVRHFAAPGSELASFLKAHPNPAIEWLPYDWSLNRAVP